jgi:MSHA biogenesis protein MshQ
VGIRSGRVRVLNAYGSELLDLPMTMRAEYWLNATNGWQINTADSCTTTTLSFAAVGTNDITTNTCVWDTGSAPGNSGKACITPIVVTSRQFKEGAWLGLRVTSTCGSKRPAPPIRVRLT